MPCILARECGGFCGVVVTDNGDGECTGALGGLLDPEEGDIDRESCLEYECEHDLDDIDWSWRLNGRRAVTLTIFLLKETVNRHQISAKCCQSKSRRWNERE